MRLETINIAAGEVSLWRETTRTEYVVTPSEGTITVTDDDWSYELDQAANEWLATRLLNRAARDMAAEWRPFNGRWIKD